MTYFLSKLSSGTLNDTVTAASVPPMNCMYRTRYCFTHASIVPIVKRLATPHGEDMPNQNEVDMNLVSDLIKSKRGNDSLRTAAEQIGISAPTLQRIEAKQVPNTSNLLKVAEWLGVSFEDLRKMDQKDRRRGTVEQIEVYLRADPDLDREAASTIANVVKQVYDGFKKTKTKKR